jgi:hypothetical protein
MPFLSSFPSRLITLTSLAAAALAFTGAARAQTPLAPPAQSHVAAIGAAPLRAPATADFAPGGSLTLEGWFYLTANTPYGWLMGKGLATSGTDPFVSFALQLNSDGTKLAFLTSTGVAGSYRELVAPAAVPLRTWTHVAAVLENGTTTRLLVNGTIVASGTAAGAPLAAPSVPFGVGSAYLANGGTNYPGFPGFARHVRLWSTARTAAQISADASVALPSNRTGLIAAWPLDESSGATARDLSGANRPLTASTGSIASTRLAVLEIGPFFSTRTVNIDPTLARSFDQAIALDFDGDGDSDIVGLQLAAAVFPANPSRLVALRNTGGILVEATNAVLGDVRMEWPARVFAFDANRDGRADLFIAGFGTDTAPFPGEQPRLLIQTADGRLVDETAARLPQQKCAAHGAAIGDIDGDGDIDIYMSNLNGGTVGPRFYINDGRGNFSESADRIPSDIANRQQRYTASALVDVNGDGFPDLVLGGFAGAPDELLINDGSGRFVRNPRFIMPARTGREESGTLDIGVADFDGNGAPDLLLGCTGGKRVLGNGINEPADGYRYANLRLLLNRGNGTFFDASDRLQFKLEEDAAWIQTVVIGDFNNDGRPDAAILGRRFDYSAMQQLLLLNRGGGQLVNASEGLVGPALAATPTFIAPADFDRDGSMDFFTQNNGQFYQARGLKTLDRALFQTTPDDAGRITGLSIRSQAGTGSQTLITGFSLGGAGTKPLLVRATGPALAGFGVPGTLTDPKIELAPLGGATFATNDDWGGTTALKNTFTAVGAFPIADAASKDAALLVAPSAGGYTATVTGANLGTGVALVEVYDAGTGNTPRLTALSARTQVGTGADALVAGFSVSGNVPKKLLIRATGPTLGVFGVGGTLVDPVLEVRPLGVDNIVATSDDWRGTAALKAAYASVGAFPFASDNSKDAAIVIELPPGGYTATITGKNSTTGVALIEVYELP